MDQKKQKISILGSGWLGLPLTATLLSSGHTVKLSTRSQAKIAMLAAKASSAHLIDIDKALYDPDFFISDLLIINITSKNIDGFKKLVEVIADSKISHVIFTSATSVYQNTHGTVDEAQGPINESHPLFQIEELFRNHSTFDATIIRLAGLIGGSRHPGHFFKDKTVPYPLAPVNLIHLTDCIGIIKAIIEQNYWNQTVNACADSHPSKKAFYTYARSLTSLPKLEFASEEINHYKIVSNTKIKTALNYQFVYSNLLEIPFN